MKQSLRKYNLTEFEVNMVQVFMLMYGYNTVEELLNESVNNLRKHKGWNDEVSICIKKMKKALD